MGLQRGLLLEKKTLGHAPRLLLLQQVRVGGRAVFEHAFAGFKGEVQAVKVGVALFQPIDHAQALQVVLKTAPVVHAFVQSILSSVAKRGVAQVVCQADGFDQILVQAQGAGNAAAHLRHFQRVRQARAKQVALMVYEHLGFIDQAAKSAAVHDAVAVALVVVAGGGGGFSVTPPSGGCGVAGPGG